jgi:Xaa-Pro dipeptidase
MPKIRYFHESELADRVSRVRGAMRTAGLEALLLFSQESLNYLTGYDTTGYVFFQTAVLTADETPITLLTRRPDLAQARDSSTIEDIRVWYNAEDANPAGQLRDILKEKKLKGSPIGIELDGYGLTAANYLSIARSLKDFCQLQDASRIVRELRLVKSTSEIAYTRKAAALADAAVLAMFGATKVGVLDGSLTAAGLKAVLEGGGDMPPDGPIVNSGPRAIYGRSVGGGHAIEQQDQILIEFAATYARYNACIERTILVGTPSSRQKYMFETCRHALAEMTAAAKPDRPIGEIDDAHRRVLNDAGFGVHRYGACGYSLGNTYRPSWMDVPPMIFSGNSLKAEPGMILFPHVMLGDVDQRLAIGLGYTILVTTDSCEVLSKLPIELLVR